MDIYSQFNYIHLLISISNFWGMETLQIYDDPCSCLFFKYRFIERDIVVSPSLSVFSYFCHSCDVSWNSCLHACANSSKLWRVISWNLAPTLIQGAHIVNPIWAVYFPGSFCPLNLGANHKKELCRWGILTHWIYLFPYFQIRTRFLLNIPVD